MRRHRRRFLPRLDAEQFGHREVDDAQPGVVTEDEFRRGDLGVDDPSGVRHVERPARLEADHERLRGLEEAPPVEQVAQTPAAEVLDDPEHRRLAVDLELARVEHLGDVGMDQRLGDRHLTPERRTERLVDGPLRTHDLDRHGEVGLGVDAPRR